MKWQKTGPALRGCRGMITLPAPLSSGRGCASADGYRGRADRRHSGPSNYGSGFHHPPPTDGNDFGSYNGGVYRGRGRPVPGRGSARWSERAGRGGGFGRAGRYDSRGGGRNFDPRHHHRGPSADDFPAKYYGHCEVRPARGAPAKPRGGFHHSSTPPAPPFP